MAQKIALITGASRGLGLALAKALAQNGWKLLIDGRNPAKLLEAKKALAELTEVIALSGDVRDEVHLLEVAEALEQHQWSLNLVVNNASSLGVSPMKDLLSHPIEQMHTVLHTNMIAPISLLQKVKPFLKEHAAIINVSSDAGAEHYETWGVYGGSKAGLDHMTAILAKESPAYRWYAFDPGDMLTDMHQEAFPGEDISDRPLPTTFAVPAILNLIGRDLPSGRYVAQSEELLVAN